MPVLQSYSWITFAQARAELGVRLGDPGNVQWIDNEKSGYLLEALRTWQALTGYWRDRGTVNGINGQVWYDLPTLLKDQANNPTLRPYTVTDSNLVASIQYSLVENAGTVTTGVSWIGTDMFTLAQVTTALQRRRDQFLKETGTVLTPFLSLPITPNQPRYGLPNDTVIDIRRMAWIDRTTGKKTTLWRQDEWESNAFNVNWAAGSSRPKTYSVSVSPVLTFAFGTLPVDVGAVELLLVDSGASLNPMAGVLLGMPDDWSWVVRWGALADLLTADGQALDTLRADYALERWQQGVELARAAPSALVAQINGRDRWLTPISDLDLYQAGWENNVATDQMQPNQVGVAGLNLVAFSRIPSSTPLSMTLDVIRNAPLPVLDTDFVQLGREEFDALLGYAEHLACFKLGGNDFTRTSDLYSDFLTQAATYADRVAAYSPFAENMARAVHQEAEKVARRYSDQDEQASTDAKLKGAENA
jgi:hypothetical protein